MSRVQRKDVLQLGENPCVLAPGCWCPLKVNVSKGQVSAASSEGALPGPCPIASGPREGRLRSRTGSRPVQQERPAWCGALHGLGCLLGAHIWSNHRRKAKKPRTMHGSAIPGSLSCTRQDLSLSPGLPGPHCLPFPPHTLGSKGRAVFSSQGVPCSLTSGLMGSLTRH